MWNRKRTKDLRTSIARAAKSHNTRQHEPMEDEDQIKNLPAVSETLWNMIQDLFMLTVMKRISEVLENNDIFSNEDAFDCYQAWVETLSREDRKMLSVMVTDFLLHKGFCRKVGQASSHVSEIVGVHEKTV